MNNKILRVRTLISTVFAATLMCAPVANAAEEDSYPGKPIRMIVATSAGGTTDGIARLFADKMTEHLGQPVMVENRPGAGSMLGSRLVAEAEPDGYTLLVSANTIMTMPNLKDVGFTTDDLVGVAEFSRGPSFVVVSSDSEYQSIEDLVSAVKQDPESVSYATVGKGSTSHIIVELFAQAAGVKFYPVPYKGSSLAIPDVLKNRVDFMVGPLNQVSELIRSGEMKALAGSDVSEAKVVEDVPTFSELGYDSATYPLFFGVLAPAGTPDAIRKKLSDSVQAAKQNEGLVQRLVGLGQHLSDVSTPEQFDEFLRKEEKRYAEIIEAANITID